MNLKTHIGGISSLYLSRLLRISVTVFSNALVVRYLGTEQLGRFRFIVEIGALLIPFIIFSQDEVLGKKLLKEGVRPDFIGASFFVQFSHALIIIALIFLLTIFREFHNSKDLIIYSSIFIFYALQVPGICLSANLKSFEMTFSAISSFLIASFAKVIVVKYDLGFYSLIFATILEYVTLSTFNFYFFYKNKWEISFNFTMQDVFLLYKKSLGPFLISLLIVAENSLPLVLISNKLNNSDFAFLSLANSILVMIVFFPQMISVYAFPDLVRDRNNLKQNVSKLLILLIIVSVLFIAFSLIFSSWFFSLLYGTKFISAAYYFKILSFSSFAYFTRNAIFKVLVVMDSFGQYFMLLFIEMLLFCIVIYFWKINAEQFALLKTLFSVGMMFSFLMINKFFRNITLTTLGLIKK